MLYAGPREVISRNILEIDGLAHRKSTNKSSTTLNAYFLFFNAFGGE